MRRRWTRRLGIVLGLVFAVDCVIETLAHRSDGVAYWFGTTFAATVLVLAGSLHRWANPFIGAILVAVGAAVGLLPTAWTVVVPVFAFGVVALTIVDAGLTADGR
jgi:hypothetical protein